MCAACSRRGGAARGAACRKARSWGTCICTSAISRDAEAFYHQALGLDKIVWSYPGALFMSAGGYHHHLGTNTWSSGAPAADDQARLLSWEIVVPQQEDARAAASSLRSAGHGVSDVSNIDGGAMATESVGHHGQDRRAVNG